MFTLAAWYESINPGGALANIAAVQDQHLFTEDDDIRVPDVMESIIGAAALVNDATGTRAQLESPSLRRLAVLQIEPIVLSNLFGEPPEVLFHPRRPIPLSEGEGVRFLAEANPAAAVDVYGLIWLADGAQQPVEAEVFSVRAEGQNVGAAGEWTLSAVNFDQTLPVGTYQVVGFRCRAATAVAARLVFPGGLWRPGVPVVNAVADEDLPVFRMGRAGMFGQFHTNQPPQVELLGPAGGTPVFLFDLLRVQ